ncbi:hypothetical protein E0W68_12915, partial [Flavobacterium salilacus subsp. salilacus]|uniref:immunoglobulin domain-containing protein n=1 Tax=Flavobacterium TaxID=237 RepID=UPI001966E05A
MKSKEKYYLTKIIVYTVLLLACNHSYSFSENTILLPPVNDDCSGAITLTVNPTEVCTNSTTITYTQATASTQGAVCTSQNGADVWYEFTANATSQTITLSDFTGMAQPMVIVLYEGDCTTLTQLSCSQNNVLNASGLTIGEVYKVKVYFSIPSPNLNNTLDICITTPPPPSNNNQTDCLITTINYDFELPEIPGGVVFINHNEVQGWRTTASDQAMEFWGPSNPGNVPAYSGTQFIELNANVVSGIYQDYQTPQPTVFTYGFAHRGRLGTDTCQLLAGPPTGPFLPVGAPTSTGSSSWSYNTGTYEVPEGQTITRFIFQSISSVGGASLGNFLDAISFTANNGIISPNPFNMDCGDLTANLVAAGVGTWSAHPDNPSPVTISDPSANNVQISGFTLQGNYYFNWTTQYCTSTIEVTYTGATPQNPVVNDITYCQNQTAVPINIPANQPNNTIIYYSGGSQLSEAPTPDTSALGSTTYYVIQESDAGCQSVAVPLIVTIVPGETPATGFTLPEEVCDSDISITPTLDPDITPEGIFTATPGVVIDASTGTIDLLSSTLGTHDITYTIAENANNCITESSSTVTITINSAPTLISATPLELCDDNFDGFAIFDLTPAGAEVIDGQTGLTVTYHETL